MPAPNDHTSCSACSEFVRQLWSTAAIASDPAVPRADRLDAFAQLRVKVEQLRPFIEQHFENQSHADSPHLVDARFPKVDASLVLDRGLPL